MKRLVMAAALSFACVSPSFAAIEIDESQDFGPTYGSMAADITIGKPLQFLGAVLGTTLHVVGYPFAAASNSTEQSHEVLVEGPWNALKRCNGCTPAYDNYINSQNSDTNQVRFVVEQPSEIIINTDGTVVISH